MPKPQRSTKDRWLDEFADFPVETQESLLDTCEHLHRQSKRREARKPESEPGTGHVSQSPGYVSGVTS